MTNTNNSATGGYLVPGVKQGPLDDEALEDLIHDVIAGIIDVDGSLVWPMWQQEPPPIPADGRFTAFGVADTHWDSDPYIQHVEDVGDQLYRNQTMTWVICFYGSDAGQRSSQFINGIPLSQNRNAFRQNGIGYIEVDGPVTTSELFKERYLKRLDCRLRLRRAVVWTYPILHVLGANIEIITDTGYEIDVEVVDP